MTNTQKLETLDKLIAAVEAGDESWVHFPRISELHTDLLWKAYHGSLDAALALRKALLPEPVPSLIYSDARLELLRILKAYRAQEE